MIGCSRSGQLYPVPQPRANPFWVLVNMLDSDKRCQPHYRWPLSSHSPPLRWPLGHRHLEPISIVDGQAVQSTQLHCLSEHGSKDATCQRLSEEQGCEAAGRKSFSRTFVREISLMSLVFTDSLVRPISAWILPRFAARICDSKVAKLVKDEGV